MTREKLAKIECYKINGKHYPPKNYWPDCLSRLQFQLLIDLMFESVQSNWRRSLPLSLLAKPVDSVIRKRSNSICHLHCLAGNSIIIFFNSPAFFIFAKSLLRVDLQLSDVFCSPAEWRRSWRESNSSCLSKIQILHWLVDADLYWAF